jgi:hypothetical protein
VAALSDRRWRRGLGRALWWAVVAIGVLAELHRPADAGGGQLAFFGALFTLLGSAFAWLAGQAVTIAVTVAQVAIMIATAVGQFALLAAGVFARVFGFLGQFWSGVLRPFIVWSWDLFNRFAGWLQRTFAPIIKFLNDVRAEVQKIYDKWLRPVFDTISVVRQTLQILATLRVPFARALDQKLAQLESALLAPILELYRLLNEAQNWINRIVTLDGLLQRVTLLRSVVRDIYSVAGIWQEAFSKPVTPADYAKRRQQAGERTIADVQRDTAEVLTTGGGPYGPFVQEWSAIWRAEIQGRR